MCESSPNYFNFQKECNYYTVEENPTFSNTIVYAVYAHFGSDLCSLVTNFYHVLIDATAFEKETLKENQNFSVPCFTVSKFLISTAATLETYGDVFTKLKLAVEFNCS